MDVNAIAQLSMAMSATKIAQSVSISVLKMSLDQTEMVGEQLSQIVDSISNGSTIDISV